ncbi:MAG: hypothetical protein F8N39_17110 [Clostridiaceae bacterium]|nr:hypothetical protein [Clostridiaceae bacterium]
MNPSVVAAIKTRAAQFTACPIVWPNVVYSPATDDQGNPTPFIVADITGLSSSVRSIGAQGDHWLKDNGFIRFHVMTPYGSGTDVGYALSEQLASIFRMASFGGIQCFAPMPAHAEVNADDGNWFITSFSVPFYYYYLG